MNAENILYDIIGDWKVQSPEHWECFLAVKDYPTTRLIETLDEEENKAYREVYRTIIANRLALIPSEHIHYLIEQIEEIRDCIQGQLNDHEKHISNLLKHRHDKTKSYSEKPVY